MNGPQEKRLTALKDLLDTQPFDTLMVLEQENRRYLSGFAGEDGQCDESAGALFITAEKQVLATDSRYFTQAQKEAPLYDVFCYDKGLAHSLGEILDGLGTKKLGFETEKLSFLQYTRLQECLKKHKMAVTLQPSEGLVAQLRAVKDETEILAIRESLSLAESVFEIILETLAPGVEEKALAWAIEKGIREGGAEAIAFPPIVASGTNAARPHATPTERPIETGKPLLFDWGARLNGYCSDVSRTVILGQPDKMFETVYQVVKDAQAMALEIIKPGISTQEVDRVARDHIGAKGFAEYFGHGLGHGVGLATHEKPHLSPLRPTNLEVGMVTTIEPGIYLPDWGGIRLENLIVVRKDGAEVLNRLDLDPRC
jgi:Xaa-Pro aminopeptidase